jgi:hypothetical protein
MSLSESCSCGASFSAERDDELGLLNQWRKRHKCPKPQGGALALSSSIESVDDFVYPELRIGFRGDDDDK